MTDKEEERDATRVAPDLRLKRLLCKRTGERLEPLEHERCPYCFGRLAEVETGRHESFCDYREGVDPIHFGFPAEDSRLERG